MARARKKTDPNKGGALQMSFFMPESKWKLPNISDLPSWRGAKRVAIDAETFDRDLTTLGPGTMRDGRTVGWAFAIEGGPKHYLPFRHEGGDNLPEEAVLGYLRHQLKDFDGELVGANLAYDYDYALNDDLKFHPDLKFRDVQIAAPLINELHRSYSLKNIGERLGIEAKDEEQLYEAARSLGLDPKRGLWRMPGRYVGEYAEQDVASPLEIYRRQRDIIESQGLQQIFDVESDLLPVLIKMRRRGVRIDQDKLQQISDWSVEQEKQASALIKRETGVEVGFGNFWKPGVLAPALEEIGLRLHKTSTGAPQIDKSVLSYDHPVAKAILRGRKVSKIGQFRDSIEKYLVNGRIHCSFRQMATTQEGSDEDSTVGVRYGRLSAADPNLQQQPSPDRDPEIAGEWRKIFIPEDGAIWGCNDYSQQEPRWTTHFAAVMDLPKAQEAARRYREDPSTDNHEMMTRLIHGDEQVERWLQEEPKLFKVNRGYSKNIFLGLCYGEGGAKLCHDIGQPTLWAHISGWGRKREIIKFANKMDAMAARAELGSGYVKEIAGDEGQAILDNFDTEVPYVRELANRASDAANARGFVKTILGRRLHFEQREDGSYDFTHKSLNRVIQGSSADQTKLAIVELDRAGYFIQLQVHDETDGSFGSVEEARAAGDIMRDCILDYCNPQVPFKVDTECGPSWGEIK